MADIRVGIIGLDTSHAKAFSTMYNDEKAETHVPGAKIVAAYPSFSPNVEKSAGRVEDYKKILSEQYGVKLMKDIPSMLAEVDAVYIASVDGRRHLPELQQVAPSGKPTFIDKPFSASLADAKKMVALVRETKLPCFSSSALRFISSVQKFMAEREQYGKVQGCDAYSPAHLEKTNPGLFWYGIHGVEILFTVMGTGLRSVRCSSTEDGDMAVGVWADGRIGTMRGIRKGQANYGATVICDKVKKELPADDKNIYAGLAREMVKFWQTKQPPVPIEQTLEICAFIDAAWRSSQEKCGDVKIEL